MQKKETHLEVFKNALTSTVKSISEKKNCEITFGKQTSNVNNKNEINLPEIDKLEDIKDYSIFRAIADSEALRLKYSNSDIYNCLLYTSPSPRDLSTSRMPSSA